MIFSKWKRSKYLQVREKSQLEGKSLKCVSTQIKKKTFCESNDNYNEQQMINMNI